MHILIVEDDPVVADVLGMTLEETGHFPSIAPTIEVALAELRHNDIDAALLDINLPDGDGTRLARPETGMAAMACPALRHSAASGCINEQDRPPLSCKGTFCVYRPDAVPTGTNRRR